MELEQNREKLRARGLGLAAVSYDSIGMLKNFASRRKIGFPLLSDPESKIIRSFGLLNESVPKGPFYGIPHPGTFLVDREGVVTAKYFEEDYTQRFTTSDILIKEFGAAGAAHQTVETKHLKVSSSASAASVRSGQRIALALDIEMKPGMKGKMHVYAPGVQGYMPIEMAIEESVFKVHAAEYPKSRMLRLKAIKETVPVYAGTFRILREVTIPPDAKLKPVLSGDGGFVIKGTLKYQACDDKVCYVPQTVPLEWKFLLEGHDRERGPKELQRK